MRVRFFLAGNVAVRVGILVPLLVLFGVKNGVYNALIGEMLADPINRQIDTAGNVSLSPDDIAPLREWPEIAFMTPKVRGQFDFMNVRKKGGRLFRPGLVVPSGLGDPTLPNGLDLGPEHVAVSAGLAAQLDLMTGDTIQMVSQAEDRPRQLLLERTVVAVLPEKALGGRAVLAPFATLDLIEAFYDSYSLPDYRITGTKDLADRKAVFAGLRAYAHTLQDLAKLQVKIERQLGIATVSQVREVDALLSLGRRLDLALAGTAVLASVGLGAALVLGFWSEVMRKRAVLAGIALIGVPGRTLAVFPMIQAGATAVVGLVLSFAIYAVAGQAAASLFSAQLPSDAPLAVISPLQVLAIAFGVMALALGAAALAGWRAQRLDPASVLREGS